MVIARYTRNNNSTYLNVFEKSLTFVANQILRLLADFKLYNIETNTFNLRVIVWIAIFSVPVLMMAGLCMAACVKFVFF